MKWLRNDTDDKSKALNRRKKHVNWTPRDYKKRGVFNNMKLTWCRRHSKWCDFLRPFGFCPGGGQCAHHFDHKPGYERWRTLSSLAVIHSGCPIRTEWLSKFNSIAQSLLLQVDPTATLTIPLYLPLWWPFIWNFNSVKPFNLNLLGNLR